MQEEEREQERLCGGREGSCSSKERDAGRGKEPKTITSTQNQDILALRMAGGRHSFSSFGSLLPVPPPQHLVALLHPVVSASGTVAVKQNCQFEGLDFRPASIP